MTGIRKNRILPCNEQYGFFHLETFLQCCKQEGFESIELYISPPHLWVTDSGIEEAEDLTKLLKKYQIRVPAVQADYRMNRYLLNTPDPMRRESSLRFYENCLRLAKQLGSEILSVRLNGDVLDEPVSHAEERAVFAVRSLCELGRKYHVQIALDIPYSSQSRLFQSAGEVGKLLREVDHPSLLINIDTAVISEAGESLICWLNTLSDRVGLVRVSDVSKGSEGSLPLKAILEELEAKKYQRFLTLPLDEDGVEQDPVTADRDRWKWMECQGLFEEAAKEERA